MLRTSKFKIILVNIFLFLVLLLSIEAFFVANRKYRFLTEKPVRYGLENIISLTPEQVQADYGFNILAVPPQYKVQKDLRFTSFSPSMMDYEARALLHGLALRPPYYVKKHVELRLKPPHQDLVIYSADYILNEKGMRTVENQSHKKNADKFIITLGDSFTFGEGVDNGEDYPSQLAKKIGNDWKIYNKAMFGGNVNDYLSELENDEYFLSDVKEKKGVVIWYFIDDQFERFFCNLVCYETGFDAYIKKKPYYKYENNDFVYKGSFEESTEPVRVFKKFLAKSEAVKYSGISFYEKVSDEQLDIMAKSFTKLFSEIRKKVPAQKFYFVAMNSFKSRTPFIRRLRQEKDITVVDLTRIPQHMEGQNLKFPLDGHPTKEFYWILSEALKNKISLD